MHNFITLAPLSWACAAITAALIPPTIAFALGNTRAGERRERWLSACLNPEYENDGEYHPI